MAYIPVFQKLPTVYILSNYFRTVFYTGVTGWPWMRIPMHRLGIGSRFAARYRCRELVYFEHHQSMTEAIMREKRIKRWKRSWKLRLIRTINPGMKDLKDF